MFTDVLVLMYTVGSHALSKSVFMSVATCLDRIGNVSSLIATVVV